MRKSVLVNSSCDANFNCKTDRFNGKISIEYNISRAHAQLICEFIVI